MYYRAVALALFGAILMPVTSFAEPVATADAEAIRGVIERQADAWNRHDMDAYLADTTVDVDWVNIVGMHWAGRETVRRAHAALHQGIFAHSRMLKPDKLELRQIAPGVVIAVKVTRIEGVQPRPDGRSYPDAGNVMTFVFLKTDVGWPISHAHNTSIDRDAAARNPVK
jgi:uncharacterized protein (TIGR02246 family)